VRKIEPLKNSAFKAFGKLTCYSTVKDSAQDYIKILRAIA